MTVETTTSRTSYTGSGTTGPFDIPFYFLEDAHIRAILVTIADGTEDELTLNVDFTLSGAGEEEGGSLTLTESISSSYQLVIFRDPAILQESRYPRNDPFPAASHERVVDLLTMICQRTDSLQTRSLRQPDGDTADIDALPAKVTRASKYMAFDADGDPIATEGTTEANPVSAFAATILDDDSAGDVLTTLGVSAYVQGLLDNEDSDELFQSIVTGATLETSPAVGDLVMVSDVSTSPDEARKMTLENVLKVVNGLTEDTVPVSSTDFVLTYDASASGAKKAKLSELPLPRGFIDGCVMANNATDATNDIDISAGRCRDSTDAKNITVAAMTKRLDAGWAAGTNQGFRNSAAAITDTTYHVYAVAKADGTQDFYAHTSTTVATVLTALQAETGGADYVYARRIFSILRESNAIVGVIQHGDNFYRKVPVSEWADNSTGTSRVTKTIKVPVGINVLAMLTVMVADHSAAADHYGIINSPDATDTAPTSSVYNLLLIQTAGGHDSAMFTRPVLTNTSAQVSYRMSQSGADIFCYASSEGWTDKRGKDA